MSRPPSPLVAQRHEGLRQRIREFKAEPPFWGYRRIWAYLHFVERRPVNKKRGLRLMREHRVVVTPNQRLKAKRTPGTSTPKPTKPHGWWGIDMTKVLIQCLGWVYIVVVLDGYTTTIVGHSGGVRCAAQH
jgi:putative transposase